MLNVLLNLRLLLLDGFNALPDADAVAAAHTWMGLLEAEADALMTGAADWVPVIEQIFAGEPDAVTVRDCDARARGRADSRLSLILADQLVAALIRGHLAANGAEDVV